MADPFAEIERDIWGPIPGDDGPDADSELVDLLRAVSATIARSEAQQRKTAEEMTAVLGQVAAMIRDSNEALGSKIDALADALTQKDV